MAAGTKDDPWLAEDAAGHQRHHAVAHEAANPAGAGVLRQRRRAALPPARVIEDLHAMLKAHGDWMELGSADEQKEAKPGTVEAWARSPDNPVGGWYGLKKAARPLRQLRRRCSKRWARGGATSTTPAIIASGPNKPQPATLGPMNPAERAAHFRGAACAGCGGFSIAIVVVGGRGVSCSTGSWWAAPPEGGVQLIAHRGVHQTFDRADLKNDTCTAERMDPPTHGYLENTIPSMQAAFARRCRYRRARRAPDHRRPVRRAA